jgi:hypothetical protein
MDIKQTTRLRDWLSAILEAKLAIGLTPADSDEAHKLAARNQVLGGAENKAAFMGTVAAKPTVSRDDLRAAGVLAGVADDLIAERDELRRQAFELAPVEEGK